MSAITTIAILPVLAIVLTTTAELGALRVVASRARSAADLAALIAVNDQDDAELSRTGRLVPSADAADVARSVFAQNLGSIADLLASTPDQIATTASIQVDQAPPTVRVRAIVPVRTPVFGALFLQPITQIAIQSNGGAR